ncbi:DUF4870 domain-containing protein [Tenacibaculum aestuariivivum]|uniref:DUF4870 domain-containing protein n=1 Tax=Tenacibaculum aestuariivivum TaxID=2006131 RepID=UPI003AB575BB
MQNYTHTDALLIHISAFAGYMFPFGSILAPLILWQILKNKDPFLDKQGKAAINFNLSFSLYFFIVSTLFFVLLFGFLFGSFLDLYNETTFNFETSIIYKNMFALISLIVTVFLCCLISISKIMLIIIASIKANKGKNYTYPFTINFIK